MAKQVQFNHRIDGDVRDEFDKQTKGMAKAEIVEQLVSLYLRNPQILVNQPRRNISTQNARIMPNYKIHDFGEGLRQEGPVYLVVADILGFLNTHMHAHLLEARFERGKPTTIYVPVNGEPSPEQDLGLSRLKARLRAASKSDGSLPPFVLHIVRPTPLALPEFLYLDGKEAVVAFPDISAKGIARLETRATVYDVQQPEFLEVKLHALSYDTPDSDNLIQQWFAT